MRLELKTVCLTAMMALVTPFGYGQEAPPRRDESPAEGRDRMLKISPLTKVQPPDGVEVRSRGSSESPGNYREWNALARGSISPSQLLEHYSDRLATEGWSFRPLVEEGPVALRMGEYRDSAGVRWHVLMLSAPSFVNGETCTLLVRLTQLSPGVTASAP